MPEIKMTDHQIFVQDQKCFPLNETINVTGELNIFTTEGIMEDGSDWLIFGTGIFLSINSGI